MEDKQPKRKYKNNTPEYNKKYYENNKNKFSEYMNKIKHCEICNKDFKANYYYEHIKTVKHKKNADKNNISVECCPYTKKIKNLINKDPKYMEVIKSLK